MNRVELQELAFRRLAVDLSATGHFDSAYYLAGYAVQCGLKACIARKVREHDFPDRTTVNDSYTHNLAKLLKTAELEKPLLASPGAVVVNWTIVARWSEGSRYEQREQAEAEELISAITDPSEGVLQWIKQHW